MKDEIGSYRESLTKATKDNNQRMSARSISVKGWGGGAGGRGDCLGLVYLRTSETAWRQKVRSTLTISPLWGCHGAVMVPSQMAIRPVNYYPLQIPFRSR